jgi:membrane-associated phospholipid phosphatase
VTLALASPAAAQSDAAGSVYRLNWAADLTTLGVGTAAWVTPEFFLDELVTKKCPCDRVDVPAIDRVALGRSSSVSQTASQVAITVMLSVPLVLDAVDVRISGGSWAHVGEDVVVMTEALVVNGGLNELVKVAVQRPRPFTYDGKGLSNPDSYLSFYSAHTSNAFAMGMAYATTFSLRHPDSGYRYLVYGAVIAGGGTTGLLRVLAGKHFPTDVIVGAVAGSAIGITVPLLHRRREVSVGIFPGGVSVMGSF